jgi:hypothetical protein
MSQMSCPRCGLSLSFRQSEKTGEGKLCSRCLARGRGALSLALRPGTVPNPVKQEDRVRMLLCRCSPRKHSPRKVAA